MSNEIESELYTKSQVMLALYKEHSAWSRHQESQRSIVGNLIITISAILISVITYDKAINTTDLPSVLLIIILGIFGALFSYKYYERFIFHDNRIEEYKLKIEKLFPDINLQVMDELALSKTSEEFTFLKKYRLHFFWIFFHLLVAVGGIFLLFLILY